MPSKTITEVKEVVKYVQVQQHSVTVTKPDGTSTTTVDTNLNSHTTANSNTVTDINKKTFRVMPFVAISQDNKGFGVFGQKDMWGGVGVGVGGMYSTSRQLYGMVGISLAF